MGLVKTGTTTLQKRCFELFDNTVTTNSTDEWKRKIRDELVRLVLDFDPSIWNRNEGRGYLELLRKACNKNAENPFFISREALLFPKFFNYVKSCTMFSGERCGRYPVSLHLEAILKNSPWISGLRVLLTLRNQPQWLASLYAEQSNYVERASQDDFELQVRQLLSDDSLDGGGFLNWGYLVQDLARVVGKNNVYVLLLEEINMYSYWENLAEATGLPFDPKDFISVSGQRENIRSDDSAVWSLRRRKNIPLHTAVYFRRPYSRTTCHPRAKKATIPQPMRRPDWYWNLRRSMKFHLSNELSAEIREYCKPFNQELARVLGRDFSELLALGY
jgi:hypothetical protein